MSKFTKMDIRAFEQTLKDKHRGFSSAASSTTEEAKKGPLEQEVVQGPSLKPSSLEGMDERVLRER